jgi:hypothetical protein
VPPELTAATLARACESYFAIQAPSALRQN